MAGVSAKANEDRVGLGIIMMLIAYFLFSFVDTSVKWLVLAGLHAFQLSFMRYLGHFAISVGLIARGGMNWRRFSTDRAGLVVLRSSFLIAATVLNFISLKYLPLTVTSAVMFSAPVMVSALSGPLLSERVGRWRWFAILLGFAGVLVVIRPFGANFHPAMLLSIAAAFSMASYSILTRKLSGVVATGTMQFYTGMLGTLVLFPLAVMTWQNPATPAEWVMLLALGFWGWSGHELLTRAHGYARANTLMPYSYSFMIYLTVSSYLVFGQLPDRWTIWGAVIIVISGLIIWARENRARRPHRPV